MLQVVDARLGQMRNDVLLGSVKRWHDVVAVQTNVIRIDVPVLEDGRVNLNGQKMALKEHKETFEST